MNTAVTAAEPQRLYCMRRSCAPRWSRPGQNHAYCKKTENQTDSNSKPKAEVDEDSDLRMGRMSHNHEPEVKEMCLVSDCDFLPLENVSGQQQI